MRRGKGQVDLNVKKQIWCSQDFCCFYCLKELPLSAVTADHLFPVCDGGSNLRSNLVVCCQPCNSEKGSRQIDWRWVRWRWQRFSRRVVRC